MELFSYLREEEQMAKSSLEDLIKGFGVRNREEVFDEVKAVLDRLRGYIKKQSVLLLDRIVDLDGVETALLKGTTSKRDQLLAEVGNLVMVHVDEPGYLSYLTALLERTEDYFNNSDKLYAELQKSLPKEGLDKLNDMVTDAVHSDVGFNSLPAPEVLPAKAAKDA